MIQEYKTSSLIITTLIVLLPLFFVPGGALTLNVAKSILLVLGVIVASLLFLIEVWRRKELKTTYHPIIVAVVLLPIIYLISALLSASSSASIFGYNLEIGTFGYILIASTALILVSIAFANIERLLKIIFFFIASLSLIVIFAAIKIFFGAGPALGIFFTNTSTPIGSWTDLATVLGLLSVLSTVTIGAMPMNKLLKISFYALFTLSTFLLIIINFYTALIFTIVFSILVSIYFIASEKKKRSAILPVILGVISIVLLINPTVSSARGTLRDVVSSTFKIADIEVRPSLSATLSVSKALLSQGAIFGSGPNTFSQGWLVHKPVEINATPFWGATFPFGIGFIPTQISSTGAVGTLIWSAFFILLIFLGIKIWIRMPESKPQRFVLATTLVTALYLWLAAILYTPSITVLTLAFISTGLLVAACRQSEIISSHTFAFSQDKIKKLVSRLLIIAFSVGFIFVGFIATKKTISAFYYKRAIDLSNTAGTQLPEIESNLLKAIKFAPADVHYTALSRVYFSMAQGVVSSTSGNAEENQALFQQAVANNITAAQTAVSLNPSGFENWMTLGMIYSALVPAPLAVNGAYESAKIAYTEALNRNPLNPEILLLRGQLEINHGDTEAARSLIRESIALKEDYVEAYLALAQLEIQSNNIRGAITSAEKASVLVPNNPSVHFELGVLKYSNGDYRGSVDAFNKALTLIPGYANAQYYLGLSLARLNQLSAALKQFEALNASNPNNPEVEAILALLRTGKSPF